MKSNIIEWPGITRLPIKPAVRVAEAVPKDMDTVLVIGWDADGEFYVASSEADGKEMLWLLELARKKLFEICD